MTNIQKSIKIGAICLAIIIIINIFGLIFGIFTSLMGTSFGFSTKTKDFDKVYNEDIKDIEIDVVSAAITIEEGNELRVVATKINNGIRINFRNKKLEIEETKSWFNFNNTSGKIVITVPNNYSLNELSIDSGAGNFVIDGITANNFEIDHGAGVLEIKNSKFNSSDIDGGAGKIKITNSTLNNLDLDSGVGQVIIEASITGMSQINCGVGEVDVTLLGSEEDYSIRVNKGIGSIKIKEQTQKNGIVYGSGNSKINIDGGVGSINIDFK